MFTIIDIAALILTCSSVPVSAEQYRIFQLYIEQIIHPIVEYDHNIMHHALSHSVIRQHPFLFAVLLQKKI